MEGSLEYIRGDHSTDHPLLLLLDDWALCRYGRILCQAYCLLCLVTLLRVGVTVYELYCGVVTILKNRGLLS